MQLGLGKTNKINKTKLHVPVVLNCNLSFSVKYQVLYSSFAYDNLNGQCWQRAIENKKKVDRAKHFWENDKLQLIKQQNSDSKSFVLSDNAWQFFSSVMLSNIIPPKVHG